MKEVVDYARDFLRKNGLDGIWINSTNEYLCEYNDLHQNSRYYLTDFSGSTGDVYLSAEDAFLFVDGRYHEQADDEVDHNIVTVVKLDLRQSQKDAFTSIVGDKKLKIGMITSKTSYFKFENYKNEFKNVDFVELSADPLEVFYPSKAKNAEKSIHQIPIEISGLSAAEKIAKITAKIGIDNALLVGALDEIAYITNLRSYNIPFSSSFKAKAIILNRKCYLFLNINELGLPVKDLNVQNIEVHRENDFENFVNQIKNVSEMILCPQSVNTKVIRLLEAAQIPVKQTNISLVADMKAIKTQQELEHMKKSFARADISLAQTQAWLSERLEKNVKTTEKELCDKVGEFFFKNGAKALSFGTIAACGTNSSIIHYTKSSDKVVINKNDLILIDCGGYFEGGYSTDMTRTFLACKSAAADNLQKQVYTTVLRGFLNGINTPVNKNARGFDIDAKVREILDGNAPEGFTFGHGTGHGVGINVHEDPPRISAGEIAKLPLVPNMCFTIEPGLYKAGIFGVRLENSVYLSESDGKYQIESFSNAQFDENLIDFSLLTDQENKWYKEYKEKQFAKNN